VSFTVVLLVVVDVVSCIGLLLLVLVVLLLLLLCAVLWYYGLQSSSICLMFLIHDRTILGIAATNSWSCSWQSWSRTTADALCCLPKKGLSNVFNRTIQKRSRPHYQLINMVHSPLPHLTITMPLRLISGPIYLSAPFLSFHQPMLLLISFVMEATASWNGRGNEEKELRSTRFPVMTRIDLQPMIKMRQTETTNIRTTHNNNNNNNKNKKDRRKRKTDDPNVKIMSLDPSHPQRPLWLCHVSCLVNVSFVFFMFLVPYWVCCLI